MKPSGKKHVYGEYTTTSNTAGKLRNWKQGMTPGLSKVKVIVGPWQTVLEE